MESLLQPNKRQKVDIVAPYAPANDDFKASKDKQLSSSFNPALLLDVTQLDLDQSLVFPEMNSHDDSYQGRNFDQHELPDVSIRPGNRFECYTVENAAILFLRFKGLNDLWSSGIAELVSEIYEQVEMSAEACSITVVERRGDSLSLIGPSVLVSEIDRRHRGTVNSLQQVLAFASYLSCSLKSTQAYRIGVKYTFGIATGLITLLCSGTDELWTARSLMGNAAYIAEEMAAVATPDAAAVHESALWLWAVATRRLPPASEVMTMESGEWRRAGAYDLERRCFRGAGIGAEYAGGARRSSI
jgi:hypothetical protein